MVHVAGNGKKEEPQGALQSVHSIWQQGNMPCSFDSDGQLPLVLGTIASDPSGQDLAPFGNKTAKFAAVFVINFLYLIYTEGTYFPSASASAFASAAQNPSSSLKWKVIFSSSA